jgi:hypothetical protein
VEESEHGKLAMEPAAKFNGATEPALVFDRPTGPRIPEHAALLIDGRVAEAPVLARAIDLQREVALALARASLATIDGRLLAAPDREEHLVDPTVLEKSLDLVTANELCAHAPALHDVRCRQGRRHGG